LHAATIAQLAEQAFRKRQVKGSNPFGGSFRLSRGGMEVSDYQRILLYVAMEEEAKMVLRGLGLKEIQRAPIGLPGSRRYSGTFQDRQIHLVVPGRDARFNVNQIGPLAAAVTLFAEAQDFQPQIIINPGIAGGFRKLGAQIGEVYLSAGKFYFHDRRISLPGYDKYAEGAYPSFDAALLAERTGLKLGVVSSGNSLEINDLEQASIDQHGAVIKDMEAAAVAWIGWEMHIPVLAVKAVTDYVDEPPKTPIHFALNFAQAQKNLSRALTAILESL
jgi:nucleoside phosphorylase